MIRALLAWAPPTLWAVLIFWLSSLPDLPGVPTFPFADKVGHLGIYGILGASLALGRRIAGAPGRLRWIALGTLYGATDEWHQSFVPGREMSAADLAADAVGVTIGFFALEWTFRRLMKPSNQGMTE